MSYHIMIVILIIWWCETGFLYFFLEFFINVFFTAASVTNILVCCEELTSYW